MQRSRALRPGHVRDGRRQVAAESRGPGSRYTELIVGYDGSERGRDALALGILLDRSIDARLKIVRFLTGGDEGLDDDAVRAEEQRIREELSARDDGIAEVSVLPAGSAAKGFERLAGSRGDRLVVLGSTHRAGLQRVFPGSVAERLLQHTRCSVAIAPRGFVPLGDELRVIAVGFNGRPESRAALEAAADLGLRAGATLRVIAVGPTLDPAQRLAQPTATVREGLGDELAAAVRDLPPELRALPVFLRGNPALLLWEKAREGVDLLVIGSGGEGPLLRSWVNDPGTALMRSAPCPIILTPRD